MLLNSSFNAIKTKAHIIHITTAYFGKCRWFNVIHHSVGKKTP